MTVFWVTWIANVGGAALVYVLARRLGPAFFKSGAGRRLMSPEAVVAVERNYVRFGLAGLIIARLLPGFRSFTAPFAGLMRLGPVRTLVPIALASGVWYGALTFLGARLGENWASVERVIRGLNRTMGVIAFLAAIGMVVWLLRRQKRTRSRASAPRSRRSSRPIPPWRKRPSSIRRRRPWWHCSWRPTRVSVRSRRRNSRRSPLIFAIGGTWRGRGEPHAEAARSIVQSLAPTERWRHAPGPSLDIR